MFTHIGAARRRTRPAARPFTFRLPDILQRTLEPLQPPLIPTSRLMRLFADATSASSALRYEERFYQTVSRRDLFRGIGVRIVCESSVALLFVCWRAVLCEARVEGVTGAEPALGGQDGGRIHCRQTREEGRSSLCVRNKKLLLVLSLRCLRHTLAPMDAVLAGNASNKVSVESSRASVWSRIKEIAAVCNSFCDYQLLLLCRSRTFLFWQQKISCGRHWWRRMSADRRQDPPAE